MTQARPDKTPEKTDPPGAASAAAPRRRAILAPILWLGAGGLLTLAVVLVLRATDGPATSSRPSPSASSRAPSAPPATSRGTLGPSGEEFAQLYLAYLLKSYYVDARGFCPNLLRAICGALVSSDLIASEKSCATLPNADLVLAIGRYQNGVGLPIDGKAGPETVRMILGGTFGSRREMTNHYCSGVAPSAMPSSEPAPPP